MAEVQQQNIPLYRRSGDDYRNYYHDDSPSSSKIIAVAVLLPVGGTLLALAALSFIGTLIGLAITAPLFLLFSPILVPAALVIAGSVAGFLTSGAFGITGLSSLSWIANYLRRQRTSYMSQQLDQAKRRAQETAGYLGQRTKDVGQKIQDKSQAQEGGNVRNTQGSEGVTSTGKEQETRTQEASKK